MLESFQRYDMPRRGPEKGMNGLSKIVGSYYYARHALGCRIVYAGSTYVGAPYARTRSFIAVHAVAEKDRERGREGERTTVVLVE